MQTLLVEKVAAEGQLTLLALSPSTVLSKWCAVIPPLCGCVLAGKEGTGGCVLRPAEAHCFLCCKMSYQGKCMFHKAVSLLYQLNAVCLPGPLSDAAGQ